MGGCVGKEPPPYTVFFDSKHWRNNFESSRKSNTLMVVHFEAPIGPCQQVETIFHWLAVRYRDVQFSSVNIDRLNDVADEFGIKAVPTILFMKSGKEVNRVVGTTPREELEKLIERHKV